MATAEVTYLGGLRTECRHLQSGTVIHTDAPTDNHGKGEKCSPTDLIATAYASCMISIIGIYCNEHGHSYEHGKASVTKIMAASPRRIEQLVISMDLRGNGWSKETSEKIVRVAKACPVAKSINELIEVELEILTD